MDKVEELRMLWDKTRSGNERSYEQLHRELYPSLISYTLIILNDRNLCEDLLQDMFAKFWVNSKRIGEIRNVGAYFHRSAKMMAIDHIRSSKVRASRMQEMPEPEPVYSTEAIIINFETDRQVNEQITKGIQRLSSRQQQIIHMRFNMDMDYNQIAQVTGIRYQSVVNHVFRAVQSLREACGFIDAVAV